MEAIIGVVGTLIGTILGWMLNSLSKRGKICIYVSDWKDKFEFLLHGYPTHSISEETTETYYYEAWLDVYNSSAEPKIMRDIKFVFCDGKTDLYQSVPMDDKTKRRDMVMTFYDEISPLTIPPKSIVQLKLHNSETTNRDKGAFIWRTNKVFLEYSNEKNKHRRALLKEEDYSKYFENYPQIQQETDSEVIKPPVEV